MENSEQLYVHVTSIHHKVSTMAFPQSNRHIDQWISNGQHGKTMSGLLQEALWDGDSHTAPMGRKKDSSYHSSPKKDEKYIVSWKTQIKHLLLLGLIKYHYQSLSFINKPMGIPFIAITCVQGGITKIHQASDALSDRQPCSTSSSKAAAHHRSFRAGCTAFASLIQPEMAMWP